MISVDYWLATLIGLIVTIVPGFWVGHLVRVAGSSVGPLTAPSAELAPQWDKLTGHNTGGWWIGLMERPLFFAAFYIEMWPIFSTWIVMKTAFYWHGTSFATLPQSVPTKADADYLIAKHQLGNHRVTTALVGTAANVLLALAGCAVSWYLT